MHTCVHACVHTHAHTWTPHFPFRGHAFSLDLNLTYQVLHPDNGNSHGFVGFSTLSDAEYALKAMNGTRHEGCVLNLSFKVAESSRGKSGARGSNQVCFWQCSCVLALCMCNVRTS